MWIPNPIWRSHAWIFSLFSNGNDQLALWTPNYCSHLFSRGETRCIASQSRADFRATPWNICLFGEFTTTSKPLGVFRNVGSYTAWIRLWMGRQAVCQVQSWPLNQQGTWQGLASTAATLTAENHSFLCCCVSISCGKKRPRHHPPKEMHPVCQRLSALLRALISGCERGPNTMAQDLRGFPWASDWNEGFCSFDEALNPQLYVCKACTSTLTSSLCYECASGRDNPRSHSMNLKLRGLAASFKLYLR